MYNDSYKDEENTKVETESGMASKEKLSTLKQKPFATIADTTKLKKWNTNMDSMLQTQIDLQVALANHNDVLKT